MPAPGTFVHANGAKWRLRSLMAMGHSPARISRAMGIEHRTVMRIISGDVRYLSAAVFSLVDALWEAWWDKRPPARTRAERFSRNWALKRAQAENWPTPVNLDEDVLDTPGYRPMAHWHPATGVGVATDYPLGIREVAS